MRERRDVVRIHTCVCVCVCVWTLGRWNIEKVPALNERARERERGEGEVRARVMGKECALCRGFFAAGGK